MSDLGGVKPAFYGFTGVIDDAGVTRLATAMNAAVNDGCDEIHIAINSPGGLVSAGVYLYNHIRAMPAKVIAYNIGSVASIAVAVFVAAEERYCSANSMFMIHPTAFPHLSSMTWDRLRAAADSALADDERTERILRDRTRLTDELLNNRRFTDVHISPDAALHHGLVHGIAEFKVPKGFHIFQV